MLIFYLVTILMKLFGQTKILEHLTCGSLKALLNNYKQIEFNVVFFNFFIRILNLNVDENSKIIVFHVSFLNICLHNLLTKLKYLKI